MDFMDSVLIIGSGGREHAILKALLRSERALCTYAYPGNAGMEKNGCISVDAPIDGWKDLARWASENEIDLVVVGPEGPLVEGVVNTFVSVGIPAFGPSAKAAEIEGSKEFSKDLMKKYNIPTADYEVFTDKKSALDYLNKKGAPIVIKASGLAAGKGAVVCDTMDEATETLDQMFDDQIFGKAGTTVVIEEKMSGEEASIFILSDGENYKILPVSQDHKAAFDGDKGPNTGGMGAYAPAPLVDDVLLFEIENLIIKPTFDAMKAEGRVYKGLLYAGLMMTEDGPKVIEYNCRFGDPETEAVLPLVECDWYEVLYACTNGTLDKVDWKIKEAYCVTVVMASAGYPSAYEKGKTITGIDNAEDGRGDVDICHAGTSVDSDGNLITNGGRVLAVCATEKTLEEAIKMAYESVDAINFEGKMFRTDIGAKGLIRI